MQEIWKDIHGYKGIYKASSKGRIISLDRTIEHNIVGSKKVEGKMLKQYLDNHGYLRINLSKNGNVKKTFGSPIDSIKFFRSFRFISKSY